MGGIPVKKVITIFVVVLLAAVALYFLWSAVGRNVVAVESALYLDDTSSYGIDSGNGNLVAVQTYMEPSDFASVEAFRTKLDGYMAEAKAQGWLQPDTIVVFPEWMGTWLVLANEKEELYKAETLEEAMQLMVLSNLPAFAQSYLEAQGEDKIRDTLFRMKADSIAQIHADTFASLAEEYGVTIVAGSLILPNPQIENGELLPGSGHLQNITPVFRPDGTLYPDLIRKVVLTNDEAAFMSGGKAEQLSTYHTPAGELGVLICADSWYPTPYEPLNAQEPEFIVVPNNFISDVGWDEVWKGYDPGPEPADVDLADIGRISEGEARLKYTLDGRMQDVGAETGMHVFFRGNIWDLTSHGHTIIFSEDGTIEAPPEARGALVNYWLPETRNE
jgi:predicted amidohydrolase